MEYGIVYQTNSSSPKAKSMLPDNHVRLGLLGMSACSVALIRESFPMCLLAGIGMILAGSVLDKIKAWPLFRSHPELMIIVPALIGLKGNLEMTLASRLSTSAHLGRLNTPEVMWETSWGNILLTQVQAIAVGFLAAFVASLLKFLKSGEFDVSNVVFLCCSSLLTASLTCLVLSTIMVTIVSLAVRWNVDPDNVATPVAASLGDFMTLWMLSVMAFTVHKYGTWFTNCTTIVLFLMLFVYLFLLAAEHPVAQHNLYDGWIPVLSAMCISSLGGHMLHSYVARVEQLAAFAPVINGVGGNIASVLASRMSSQMHLAKKIHGSADGVSFDPSCWYTLLGLNVFIQFILLCVARLCPFVVSVSLPVKFCAVYLLVAFLQVLLLLTMVWHLVPYLWTRGIDPDDAAIPYATSVGDMLGTGLLALAMHVVTAGRTAGSTPVSLSQGGGWL